MYEPETYLCHNCSDINSPSGEACIVHGTEEDKNYILKSQCLRKYRVQNDELKEEIEKSGFIICGSNMFPMETDFYIVGSDEARQNLVKVISSPLWDAGLYEITEEARQKRREFEDKRLRIHCNIKARQEIKARLDAFDNIVRAIPCTIETDPLRRQR